jgi:hypothetical protein
MLISSPPRPLVTNYSCTSKMAAAGRCTFTANIGWRYYLWTSGGLTLPFFLARFLFRLLETPKYLLGHSRDTGAVNGKATGLTHDSFRAVDAELLSPV